MPLHEPLTNGGQGARPRRPLLLAALGLLLAFLSVALWQFRFERAGPPVDLQIGEDFRGWIVFAAERFEIDGTTWTLPPPAGNAVASAEGLLPGLERTRFLHVDLEARWENVTRREDRSWWSARVSLGGKWPDGSFAWPQDGDLINAKGSQDWHRVACVFDQPPGMGEPRVIINNLAASGVLGVRNLTVTPVHPRPWIAAPAVALILGWLAWSAALIGGSRGPLRQVASSLVIVAAGWLLVFPQLNYHARPFPGGFQLGREIPPPAQPAPPVAPVAVAPPSPPVTPAPPPPAPPPIATIPAPPAEIRSGHPLVMAVRRIDQDWRFAHIAAFGLVGLALFALAGLRNSWPVAASLGLLSEIVPNLLRQEFHDDDFVDLIANFAGLVLAAALIHLAGIFLARRRLRAAPAA